MQLDILRDHDGSFAPILIPKHERRFAGFDAKIIAMYARGLSVREIWAFMAEQYGKDVSADFISSVTDGNPPDRFAHGAQRLHGKGDKNKPLPLASQYRERYRS